MTPLALTLLMSGGMAAALSGHADADQPARTDPYAGNNCVQCHQDLPGRLGEIVLLEWKNSVHYANSVTCDGCHGGDATLRTEQFDSVEAFKNAAHLQRDPHFLLAAAEAGRFVSSVRGREVSYFCGKCHALVKEKHLGSPHGDYGDPSCLYCHARADEGHFTHLIRSATLDIIDTRGIEQGGRCAVCHKAATMEAVAQIKSTMAATEALINQASDHYDALLEQGYRSLELAGLQEHGREVHSRLRRVFHSFDMREINDFAGEIKGLAERTARTHELLERLAHTRRRQTLVGLAVCAFLLGFAGLLLYYKRAFCPENVLHLDADSSRSAESTDKSITGAERVDGSNEGPSTSDEPRRRSDP
jgi:hypothetical protein